MRNPARTFEDLVVWQKAHALTLGRVSTREHRRRVQEARPDGQSPTHECRRGLA